MWHVTFLLATFKIICLSLTWKVSYYVSQCSPFRFNLFRIFWASWIWMSISLPRFGKFSTIFALNIFSVFFSLSSPSGILITSLFFFLTMSHKCCMLSSLFFILFFSFLSNDRIISNKLSSSLLILSSPWLSLLLKFSLEFFSHCILQCYDFCLFLFCLGMVSSSLLNFSFCLCTIFLILCSCLCVAFF